MFLLWCFCKNDFTCDLFVFPLQDVDQPTPIGGDSTSNKRRDPDVASTLQVSSLPAPLAHRHFYPILIFRIRVLQQSAIDLWAACGERPEASMLFQEVQARGATGASAADGEGWDDRDRWLLPPVAATGTDDDIAAVPAAVITRCGCVHTLPARSHRA